MTKKYLIVKGIAGLGNRMYTLCNAIEYAKKTHRTIYVDWSDGVYGLKGENIFYQYFSLKNIDHITNIDALVKDKDKLTFYPTVWKTNPYASVYDMYEHDSGGVLQKIKNRYLGRGRLNILNEYWRYKVNNLDVQRRDCPLSALMAVVDKRHLPMGGRYSYSINKDVVFFADFMPTCDLTLLSKYVKFDQKIEKEVIKFVSEQNIKDCSIGVHVRFTDNKPDKAIDSLINFLKDEVNIRYNKIFLATDNPLIIQLFLNNFGDRIVLYPKFIPESLVGGLHQYQHFSGESSMSEKILQDSLTEIGILLNCSDFIYQGNSTFSHIIKNFRDDSADCIDWLKLYNL